MPVTPQSARPKIEPARRLVNGEFYAKGAKIFRAPIETKTATGTNINVGFPVCTVSEYVSPENVVECLNASRDVDALRAKVDELTDKLAFAEFEWNRATDGMKERDRHVDELTAAVKDACDLLMERTQGSAARSPNHNARLRLERVLAPVVNSQHSDGEARQCRRNILTIF